MGFIQNLYKSNTNICYSYFVYSVYISNVASDCIFLGRAYTYAINRF